MRRPTRTAVARSDTMVGMSTRLKTIQWNIGGGKVRSVDDLTGAKANFVYDGLDTIIAVLRREQADIITLQEVHVDDTRDQLADISTQLSLPYYFTHVMSDSGVEAGQKLAQGILSRYPISQASYQQFENPNFEIVGSSGKQRVSHDKGVSSCTIAVDGQDVTVKTVHLIPFHAFKVDETSLRARVVLDQVQGQLRDGNQKLLLQGDFNLVTSSLRQLLPDLFPGDTREVVQTVGTTAWDTAIDHIVYRGLEFVDSQVDDQVLTDHFPIISNFLLP